MSNGKLWLGEKPTAGWLEVIAKVASLSGGRGPWVEERRWVPHEVEADVELDDLHGGDEGLGERERELDEPRPVVPVHHEVDEPWGTAGGGRGVERGVPKKRGKRKNENVCGLGANTARTRFEVKSRKR